MARGSIGDHPREDPDQKTHLASTWASIKFSCSEAEPPNLISVIFGPDLLWNDLLPLLASSHRSLKSNGNMVYSHGNMFSSSRVLSYPSLCPRPCTPCAWMIVYLGRILKLVQIFATGTCRRKNTSNISQTTSGLVARLPPVTLVRAMDVVCHISARPTKSLLQPRGIDFHSLA